MTAPQVLDLVVVGGGVMGLFTAYEASGAGRSVALLEAGTIGDPTTASFGRTRSYRVDYLDPLYVRLAGEAIRLWDEFEHVTGARALVRCGCMNIAKASVTPELAETYAVRSTEVMVAEGVGPEILTDEQIRARYPYLRADVAHLDPSAGLADLRTVAATLLRVLAERGVAIHEQLAPSALVSDGDLVRITTDRGEFVARSVVVTAGHGTNDVLRALDGCELQVPITKDRPSEAKYFTPPADERERWTSAQMPVIAYLDTGVYVHPIVDGVIDKVKVGYYNPPDIPRDRTGVRDIADFVAQVMPGLATASSEDVVDTDQCHYDLVADDHFVMGAVPGFGNVFVGVGWRGTGYKFAPWIGRTLARFVRGDAPVLPEFDPARFVPVPAGGAV